MKKSNIFRHNASLFKFFQFLWWKTCSGGAIHSLVIYGVGSFICMLLNQYSPPPPSLSFHPRKIHLLRCSRRHRNYHLPSIIPSPLRLLILIGNWVTSILLQRTSPCLSPPISPSHNSTFLCLRFDCFYVFKKQCVFEDRWPSFISYCFTFRFWRCNWS